MPTRLTEAERAALATTLPAWAQRDGRDAIHREFRFKDFSEAWGFMARVALLAEQHDHHPDWSNVWNRGGDRAVHARRRRADRERRGAGQAIDALIDAPELGVTEWSSAFPNARR